MLRVELPEGFPDGMQDAASGGAGEHRTEIECYETLVAQCLRYVA